MWRWTENLRSASLPPNVEGGDDVSYTPEAGISGHVSMMFYTNSIDINYHFLPVITILLLVTPI